MRLIDYLKIALCQDPLFFWNIYWEIKKINADKYVYIYLLNINLNAYSLPDYKSAELAIS